MKSTIRLFLCVGAALAPPWLPLRAGEPGAPPTSGHVLILDNERTLEGDVERDGDRYRIRRSIGETWVPGEKVLRLCADWKEAYAYLSTCANLQDPDERVRLARWCHEHGLREQALAEAKAALALQPESVEGRRLLQSLRPISADAGPGPGSRLETAHGPATPPVDLDLEALGQFAVRVQPILMNTCATCHSSGRGGSFKLMRAYEAGTMSRRATQQNLAAVLGQVNRQRWPSSPLLIKAVSVHGEASQPPLKGRQTPAYRAIEDWVKTTLAKNPLPEGQAPAAPASPFAPEHKEQADTPPAATVPAAPNGEADREDDKPGAEQWASGRTDDRQADSQAGNNKDNASAGPGKPSAAPAQPVGPVDEFDPVIFNGPGRAESANEASGPGK